MRHEFLPEAEDAPPPRRMLQLAKIRNLRPEPIRLGAHLCEQRSVGKAGDLELGQATLARAKEVAGAAELEVGVGEREPIAGTLQDIQALAGGLAGILTEHITVGLVLAATYAPAE